jgi:hypothetical protein
MKKILLSWKLYLIPFFVFTMLYLNSCTQDISIPPGELENCEFPKDSISSSTTNNFDQQILERLNKLVISSSKSETCDNTDDWGIAGIGHKPCGGPAGYIPYNKKNEKCFLAMLKFYNEQCQRYNIKNQLISNCMVEPSPKLVQCKNGKPTLVY